MRVSGRILLCSATYAPVSVAAHIPLHTGGRGSGMDKTTKLSL